MLAGLDAAHTLVDEDGRPLNLVHRDVSPQNVLVGVDGTARITDFGIARASSRVTSTQPGQLKGKIAYMSPEQIRSGDIDRRSDLFSTGAMLWSLLTGCKLFVGQNDAVTMNNIAHLEIPPPSTIGFKPPASFDRVCLRALQRDPAARYASAREMEDELRAAAGEAKTLGSRREVGEWVERAFHDDLATRRKAIRTVGARAFDRPGTAAPRLSAEFPSFTPSTTDTPPVGWQTRAAADVVASNDDTRPAAVADSAPEIEIERPALGRRLAMWGLPAAIVLLVALWWMKGSHAPERQPAVPSPSAAAAVAPPAPTNRSSPPTPAAPPPASPTSNAPTAAAPAASPASPAPPSATPGEPRPAVTPPDEPAAPLNAAVASHAAAPARRPPVRGSHAQPPPVHRPPVQPVHPAPPPQPAPAAAPPTPAPRPTQWDSDSPVPPQ
jgi:serine/threonine-protein kinase